MRLENEGGWHCEAWCSFGLTPLHANTWLIPLAAFRPRERWSSSGRTWISPFCWSTRETWSWRCCRKMRSSGRGRRRGYGGDSIWKRLKSLLLWWLPWWSFLCVKQATEERAVGNETHRLPSATGGWRAPVRSLPQGLGSDLWARRSLHRMSAAHLQWLQH